MAHVLVLRLPRVVPSVLLASSQQIVGSLQIVALPHHREQPWALALALMAAAFEMEFDERTVADGVVRM